MSLHDVSYRFTPLPSLSFLVQCAIHLYIHNLIVVRIQNNELLYILGIARLHVLHADELKICSTYVVVRYEGHV